MNRMLSYLSGLVGLVLVLTACTPGGLTPQPDTQATEAAEQGKIDEAVAATLAAQATATPAEVAPVTPADVTATEAPVTPPSADTPVPTLATEPAEVPPTAAPVEATCTVVSTALNVRSGPGLVYDPPLTSLPGQTQLIPIAFNGAGFPGRWVLVEVPANNLTGWVSADPQFIDCTIDVAGLPLAEAPPTPTPTNTSTPVPTPPPPSPTPIDFFVFSPEGGGGNRENIKGQLLIPPGYVPNNSDPLNLVFREGLTIRVEVYDVRSGNTSDGSGISRVEFFIEDDAGEVYFKEELNPTYCLFGGNDPLCPGLIFSQDGYTWPDGTPLRNTEYDVKVLITSERGDDANWRFSFRVEGVPAEPAELVAAIAQTGPNTTNTTVNGALAFQVEAYDPDRGTSDGAGIDSVDLQIFKNGQKVHERTERSAGYCAFSGGEPDCRIWVFADRKNQWPNDRPIEFGPHLLRAQINAKNGQKKVIELQVDLQP
jgi:hypothetical protein